VSGRNLLLFWYRNEIYCIESRSPAEGAYSSGFIASKFTQVRWLLPPPLVPPAARCHTACTHLRHTFPITARPAPSNPVLWWCRSTESSAHPQARCSP
jgi:hypothetical protein